MSFWSWVVANNARQEQRNLERQTSQYLGNQPDYNRVDSAVQSNLDDGNSFYPGAEPSLPLLPRSSAPSGYQIPVSAKSFDYVSADLAKQYNMSRSTAYQEALLNTAHQREIADLKAAGLNPVLSASGSNGAGSGVSVQSAAGSGGGGTASKSGFDIGGLISGLVQIGAGVAIWKMSGSAKAGAMASGAIARSRVTGANSAASGLRQVIDSFR